MSKTVFNPEVLDFSACVPRCAESDLHPQLLSMLRSVQKLLGWSLTFTSGFRPKSWEISRGRNGSSSHSKTPGLAVDVSAVDSHARYKIVIAAGAVGFPRIGVGKNFVHLDIDETKPHPVMWHYYE